MAALGERVPTGKEREEAFSSEQDSQFSHLCSWTDSAAVTSLRGFFLISAKSSSCLSSFIFHFMKTLFFFPHSVGALCADIRCCSLTALNCALQLYNLFIYFLKVCFY